MKTNTIKKDAKVTYGIFNSEAIVIEVYKEHKIVKLQTQDNRQIVAKFSDCKINGKQVK